MNYTIPVTISILPYSLTYIPIYLTPNPLKHLPRMLPHHARRTLLYQLPPCVAARCSMASEFMVMACLAQLREREGVREREKEEAGEVES